MRHKSFPKIVALQNLGIPGALLCDKMQRRLPKHEGVCYERAPASGEELVDRLRGATVAITVDAPIKSAQLAVLHSLRMIAISFTGMEHVDVDFARQRGIHVANVPGYSTNSVAELAVAMAINLLRRISAEDSAMRAGAWRRHGMGSELHGKTIGIVGLGDIGLRAAELFGAFGCRIVAYNRTQKNIKGVEQVGLLDVARGSDVVSLHIALTQETRGIIGRDFLLAMQPHALLINTARGPLVDNEFLFGLLSGRKIGGAALDVHDCEPVPSNDRLLGLEPAHLIATPHLGCYTREAIERKVDTTLDNIADFLASRASHR